MLYWTGKSPVKSICLISRENQFFCGLEAPAVCLCLSSDCCLQPAAQAADGNAALRRCETRWYVSKNTSTSNSLYFTAHVWRNRTREDMPVPQLIEERGNRWILAICFCKLCQPPVASPCECVIDWLVCGWRGCEWLGEKANPAHPLFRQS